MPFRMCLFACLLSTCFLGASIQAQDLLVSSRNTHSVKRFDANSGAFLGDFVAPGSGGLNATQEVAIGPDGHLYVSGRGNLHIKKYDSNTGTFLGNFTTGYDLDNPTKMTFGPDGKLYVSQWGQQQRTIARFDASSGAFIDEFPSASFNLGMDHAWDSNGNLYVVSFGSKDVRKYDSEGDFLETFTKGGNLQGPVNLWFGEGGDLFVVDWETGTVQRFDGISGDFKATFISGLSKAEGITVGPDGAIYLCDWELNRINRYDAETGQLLGAFATAGGMLAPNGLVFRDAPKMGQSFERVREGPHTISQSSTTGASWIDYDNDRDLDLFITNSRSGTRNVLYRNEDGTFTESPAGPLVTDPSFWRGHCWADYDNDGHLDVFVTGSTSMLYHNEGDGQFSRVALANSIRGWGCAWGDYDNDNYVDLVITHPAGFMGVPSVSNYLFRNKGDGSFERLTTTPITSDLAPFTIPSWSDFDLDGDLDLFIASGPADGTTAPDFLFRNQLSETGEASFARITEGVIATDAVDGQVWNWIDYDNDADLDAFLTNWGASFGGLADHLYRNDDGVYTRVTSGPLATARGVSLASIWGDFDNDADQDVFVTNGSSNQPNTFYINNGDGSFTRRTDGPMASDRAVSWGASAGDYDDDGDLDLYVANGNGTPSGQQNFLYRNNTDDGYHWLRIQLLGRSSNRTAIGAMVRIKATVDGTPLWQMREVSSQNSFLGHNAFDVHFGLKDAARADSLRIEWPSGVVDVFENVDANQILVATEGMTLSPVANEDAPTIPATFALNQNFPNPFQTSTTIQYDLPHPSFVKMRVFDSRGRTVATLVESSQQAGNHQVTFDAGHLPSGLYLYRLEADDWFQSKTLLLVK